MSDNDFDVFSISEDALFKLCQKQKIPFQQWYEWIDDQFKRVVETKGTKAKENYSPNQ